MQGVSGNSGKRGTYLLIRVLFFDSFPTNPQQVLSVLSGLDLVPDLSR